MFVTNLQILHDASACTWHELWFGGIADPEKRRLTGATVRFSVNEWSDRASQESQRCGSALETCQEHFLDQALRFF